MAVEIKITIKGEESRFNHKFLKYDTITLDHNDPIIKQCINESLNMCRFTPEDIIINAKLQVQ